MQKIIVRCFLTNHVTFESALKNYYITSCSINMKAKEKTLNQKHKFVKKIYEKMAATNLCCGTWLPCLRWCLEPTRKWRAGGFVWKKTICLTYLQTEHVVRIMKRPREIFRPTKHLIDKGGKITAKLSSTHYRRSPLFQTGLEIPCEVTVTIPANIKGHFLMQRYE